MVAELVLADSSRGVNLVSEDQEGDLAEVLDGKKGVELGLGFGESFEIGAIDEEDDAVDLREVITPAEGAYETEGFSTE